MEKAILKSLQYHQLFDYPLNRRQVYLWLYKKKAKKDEVYRKLKSLIRKNKVKKKEKYYFLANKKNIIEKRKKREYFSSKKSKTARKYSHILAKIPFIKMIAVSGSLAMQNSDKNEDIDFFITTAKNRLWISRFLCILILELLGKRRRPLDKKLKDKICLNLFLDQSSLEITQKNAYTAHEICQIKPLVNKQKTYQQFIKSNNWVEEYWPNIYKELKKQNLLDKPGTKNVIFKTILNFIDKLLFKIQFIYMRKKITNEKISYHAAFFHPQDRSNTIMENFKE